MKPTLKWKLKWPGTLKRPAYGALLLLLSVLRCTSPQPPAAIAPAFYHWQTRLQLSTGERSYLDSLGAKRLYVKFFDVDLDPVSRQAVPLAVAEIDTHRLAGLEIVPTVFITNRTFLELPALETRQLAGKIFKKINALMPVGQAALPHPGAARFREVQFDCDWSPQSRDAFFSFLEDFRDCSRQTGPVPLISATIRLHQLSFPEQTGIPPADRGMLMFYNMGDLETWETDNSILNLSRGSDYLQKSKAYPLPLDFALPLFHWGVLFRDGRLFRLVNGLDAGELSDSTRFVPIAPRRYEVARSTYLQGHYLVPGDLIRLEAVEPAALREAGALLARERRRLDGRDTSQVAFFSLDSLSISAFPPTLLKQLVSGFQEE
ncbi:MAG: hypothetical protein RI973_619 [Bacteroidota bacterium]|jgi:hypothetical protein